MLTLYKNITPNYKSTYYYFKVLSKFLAFLSSYKHDEIDANNYTIIRGSIRVKMDETRATKLSNYKNVTYIYDDTSECFYHVNNAIVESGYVFFTTSLDNFATYMYKANLSNIIVKKCNRKISNNGIYDEIKATSEWYYEDQYPQGMTGDNLAIVFALKYNVKQSTFEARSTISLFAIRVDNIKTLMVSKKSELGAISSITLALDFVGGIYGVAGSIGDLKASVINAWLIPNSWIDKYWETNVTIKSRGVFVNSDLSITTQILKPQAGIEARTFTNLDVNKDYYIGGFNNGVHIIKTCDNKASVRIGYGIGTSDVHVFVAQGNNQQDITACFQVSVATNDGNIVGLNKLAQYIRMGVTALSSGLGIGLGAQAGGGAGALAISKGIGKAGTQVASLLDKNFNTSLVGGGDGAVTFWRAQFDLYDTNVRDYVKLNYATSLVDENKRARCTGVNFNEYINTLESIFTFSLLGTGEANDDTFLQATLSIDGIPTSAIEDIENLLAGGIYLQYIQ